MNLAILVGPAEYYNLSALPGCENDVRLIKDVLKSSGKYAEIFSSSGRVSSRKLKEDVTNFILKYKDTKIEEVFFYFTGHGTYTGDAYHYTLTDYDSSKKSQTSLSNDEVDSWLRSLKPTTAVKVIDACNSGASYIKSGGEGLEKYLRESSAGLNNVYFMFSSLNSQTSLATAKISDFTLSFLESILEHDSVKLEPTKENPVNSIRYKDIIDSISDYFESNNDQRPQFVTQADYTEKFLTVNADVAEKLRAIGTSLESTIAGLEEKGDESNNLKSLAEARAKEFGGKQSLVDALAHIESDVRSLKFPVDLDSIYEFDVNTTGVSDEIPNAVHIGDWIQTRQSQKLPDTILANKLTQTAQDYETGDTFEYTSGFEHHDNDLPYKGLALIAKPKFPSLTRTGLLITHVYTRRSIYIFHALVRFSSIGWDDEKLSTDFRWKTTEITTHKLSDITEHVNELGSKFEEFVRRQANVDLGVPGGNDPAQTSATTDGKKISTVKRGRQRS